MGKPDKQSHGRYGSPDRGSHHRRDSDSDGERRERRERRERGHLDDRSRSGEYGGPSSKSRSRERERGFPAEHGYGHYQESQGWGERPNIQTYGHPGYGAQPQTYQPSQLPQGGAYGQDAYGSGQGVYAYQPTSPPPVQYQPSAYQQPTYGGGAYSGSYQAPPQEPPAGYGGAYNQGYQPPPGPPPPQGYGHHQTEYRPQEQPAAYGGYPPPPPQPAPYGSLEQGPYGQGYQPPPGPPVGTPGYHSPPPNPPYIAPGGGNYAPATYGGASISHDYKPQHHSAQQQQESQSSGQYGLAAPYAPGAPAIQSTTNLNPANPSSKPPAAGFAVSALNTFTTGLNTALHSYARTLFPATSTHSPAADIGASGDSGAPAQRTGNRFDSFAPVRGGNGVKWYVDGKDYMYAVSTALERAEKSIWIMDWWLSPELYLRRPPALHENYRLDRLLKAAAERGVHVNIIVYKEVEKALTLDSHHTKIYLESLHQNISVFRHPDHTPNQATIQSDIFSKFTTGKYTFGDGLKGLYGMKDGIVLYWAHHEKLCLVDGEIAFMGGLDLCFGRWDMNHHPIADAHPTDLNGILFPGQDFNNARLMDFNNVSNWDQNKVSRTENSRMGWSDVALSLVGPCVKDLQRHFFDRWNFIYGSKYSARKQERYQPLDERVLQGPGYHKQKIKQKIHGVGRVILEGAGRYEQEQEERAYGHDSSGRFDDLAGVQCQIVRSASKWSHNLPATEHSIAHAYIEIISAAKHFVYIENQFFITATDDKQNPIMNRIGRAIVDRILRAAKERQKFRIIVVMPAIPAFAGDLQAESSLGTRAIMEFQYRSINNDRGFSIMEQIAKAGVDPKQYIRFYNLRSYDRINTSRTMDQTQQAAGVNYNVAAASLDQRVGGGYTPAAYGYPQPHGDEYARYQQAAPGGSTELDSVARCSMLNGGDIRQVPWTGDPAKEMDSYVSEELYIHSKLLIADDRIVICGSANLNDRSQLGDHDSEIAIVIDDPTPLPSAMNGVQYQASHFAATLRRQIFRKHLGLIPAQNLTYVDENMEPVPVPNIYDFDSAEDRLVADPLGEHFWEFWNTTAKTNTDAFGKAFHTVPHDCVQNWRQYEEWWSKWFAPGKTEKEKADKASKEKPSPAGVPARKETPEEVVLKGLATEKAKLEGEKLKPLVPWGHVVKAEFSDGLQGVKELKELLSHVRGNLVEMPLDFLREEDIAKEGLELNALTETIYT